MKKLYTTHKFITRQTNTKRISDRKFRNRELKILKILNGRKKRRKKYKNAPVRKVSSRLFAPKDFRLIENTEQCLEFFRELRDPQNIGQANGRGIVTMWLDFVEQIDYGTISIINALSDDMKVANIMLKGNFPRNKECRAFMIDSGFLDHMFIGKKRVKKSENADLVFFEKRGSGILSEDDNRKIGEMIKNVVYRLTGNRVHCPPLRTIILEICGNSIEHASTRDKQWLLGILYKKDKVIFTVTDVGKGILETIHRKYSKFIADYFFRNDHEVLMRAFEQKYGSSTQEVNRNKGLPSIKAGSDQGTILNLIAISNNVMINFENKELSRTLGRGEARFRGTFYQWEVTKECIF